MKALPVILFLIALVFAYFEWQHGRAHEVVAQNATDRIEHIEVPATENRPAIRVAPTNRSLVLRRIEPGLLGTGKVATQPANPPAPPNVSPSGLTPQQAQAEQQKENAALKATEGPMTTMRIILTVLFIPACFGIILAKNRFDDKGRGFAYTTLGVILTFWLHS
jgi:hypothetical protein